MIVMFQYYMNNHFLWLILTASLVCLPSIIVQIFSIRWYIVDGKTTNLIWIMHIFQLGLFYRFLELFHEGFRIKTSKSSPNLEKFNHHQSDICMLRLFESFTESAPQLVLQLYIMVSTDDWNPWTGISAFASIVSLSWGIAAYSKAMRNIRPEKKRLSWWGLLFQSLWRIGMVSSRITAMVLFAVAYSYWLIVAIGVHWLTMIVWIFIQNTDFCTTWWEERLYNCVVGVIYCFCYFNVKEGRSRYRMTMYYSFTVLQNIGFISAFYLSERSTNHFRDFVASLVPGGMMIGLASMLLYYRFFHPSGPITLFTTKGSSNGNETITEDKLDAKPNCSTLKTCRKFVGSKDCNEGMDSVLLETPISHDNEENFIVSKISLSSMDKNVSCSRELHRSHSLNCSAISFDDRNFEFNRQRKSLANHHRNINYNFRPAAAFGSISPRTHCSCLILAQVSPNIGESTPKINYKLCSSLPNLDLSFETEDQSSLESTHLSNAKSFFSHMERIISYSSIDSGVFKPPVISNDHIIKINVEGNL
ncbi:unnamed protein product [Larinioides sclopetarius]|uniref:XK-related protein n=1 Tax=Larinioides sclopetarius TaxID=280406 RepID=A0AAV2ARV7_9ARAC